MRLDNPKDLRAAHADARDGAMLHAIRVHCRIVLFLVKPIDLLKRFRRKLILQGRALSHAHPDWYRHTNLA
ncbi:MAG: hypothetical protein RIC56_19320 [Pseudomonadales bacterium]